MAVANPFQITYAGQAVGGSSSTYQLDKAYVLDKSHDSFRLVFTVLVVASSSSTLESLSDTLEDAFSVQMVPSDTLIIDVGTAQKWTYTHGTTILNGRASIQKTGDEETNYGLVRSYVIAIEGELPATIDSGLRNVEVLVDFESGRQKTVTMRGQYTATAAGNAVARYLADFDAEATVYLTAADSQATWELVDETYTFDRQLDTTPAPHTCDFTRQYAELLANQSEVSLDDTNIRDHRIVFTDLSQHPGESKEGIFRLRRVIGSYDCAVDIEVTTNLQTVFNSRIKPHIKALFQSNFTPTVFAIETRDVSYDETSKRLSASVQFIYQKTGGDAIVEVSQSVAFREAQQIDYTYTHDEDAFAAHVDPGFANAERVWNRTVVVLGKDTPNLRISGPPTGGDAGLFSDTIGGQKGPDQRRQRMLKSEGWNIVQNTSQLSEKWIGDPDETQIALMVLTETVVERFNRAPGSRQGPPGR